MLDPIDSEERKTGEPETRNDKVEGRDMPRPCCFTVHWPKSLNTFSE